MKRTSHVIALASILAATAGCKTWCVRSSHESRSLDKLCCPPQAALVEVGGQVHAPTQIDVSGARVTLRRALTAAGGARQVVIAEKTETPLPKSAVAEKIQKLISLGAEKGKNKLYVDIYASLPEEKAREITGVTRIAAKLALDTNQRKIDLLIDGTKPDDDDDVMEEGLKKAVDSLLGDIEKNSSLVGSRETLLPLLPQLKAYPLFYVDPVIAEEQLGQARKQLSLALDEFTVSTQVNVHTSSLAQHLVALERTSIRPAVTYYFPYDLVISGQPGEIVLQAGDFVQVVDLSDTSLAPLTPNTPAENHVVAIQGLVDLPGLDSTGFSTLGQIQNSVARTTDDRRGAWMILRTSATGLQQSVFVVPDSLVNSGGLLANSPTYDGDIFTYTIVPQVPIVLDSLVKQVVDVALEEGTRDCAPRVREALQQHRERKGRFWDNCRRRFRRADD